MGDMESIRDAIVRMVQGHHPGFGFTEIEWDSIQAAIDEARPGVDEICAALRELATSQGEMELHLFDNGSGHIHHRTDYDGGKERLVSWHDLREAASAIRSLIPKPVPTPEEDLKALDYSVAHCSCATCKQNREALARIRKLIPEQ